MTKLRTSPLALLVIGCGALLFIASASFLVLLLHHLVLADDYTDIYFFVPFWLPVIFFICTILALSGFLKIRYSDKYQRDDSIRLTFVGVLLTGIAWALFGISWLITG